MAIAKHGGVLVDSLMHCSFARMQRGLAAEALLALYVAQHLQDGHADECYACAVPCTSLSSTVEACGKLRK